VWVRVGVGWHLVVALGPGDWWQMPYPVTVTASESLGQLGNVGCAWATLGLFVGGVAGGVRALGCVWVRVGVGWHLVVALGPGDWWQKPYPVTVTASESLTWKTGHCWVCLGHPKLVCWRCGWFGEGIRVFLGQGLCWLALSGGPRAW
jgi:hypothetical protein